MRAKAKDTKEKILVQQNTFRNGRQHFQVYVWCLVFVEIMVCFLLYKNGTFNDQGEADPNLWRVAGLILVALIVFVVMHLIQARKAQQGLDMLIYVYHHYDAFQFPYSAFLTGILQIIEIFVIEGFFLFMVGKLQDAWRIILLGVCMVCLTTLSNMAVSKQRSEFQYLFKIVEGSQKKAG